MVDGKTISAAVHSKGSVIGAAALVAGTTVGAGVLALPAAAAPVGFLPSSAGLMLAYVFMNTSGLLIAEVAINRIGETGKQGVGLLELYKSYLGNWSSIGVAAYFFLQYAVMVAYISQGGSNITVFLDSISPEIGTTLPGLDRAVFTVCVGSLVYFFKESFVEKVTHTHTHTHTDGTTLNSPGSSSRSVDTPQPPPNTLQIFQSTSGSVPLLTMFRCGGERKSFFRKASSCFFCAVRPSTQLLVAILRGSRERRSPISTHQVEQQLYTTTPLGKLASCGHR